MEFLIYFTAVLASVAVVWHMAQLYHKYLDAKWHAEEIARKRREKAAARRAPPSESKVVDQEEA